MNYKTLTTKQETAFLQIYETLNKINYLNTILKGGSLWQVDSLEMTKLGYGDLFDLAFNANNGLKHIEKKLYEEVKYLETLIKNNLKNNLKGAL